MIKKVVLWSLIGSYAFSISCDATTPNLDDIALANQYQIGFEDGISFAGKVSGFIGCAIGIIITSCVCKLMWHRKMQNELHQGCYTFDLLAKDFAYLKYALLIEFCEHKNFNSDALIDFIRSSLQGEYPLVKFYDDLQDEIKQIKKHQNYNDPSLAACDRDLIRRLTLLASIIENDYRFQHEDEQANKAHVRRLRQKRGIL